jgi:CPA1 family monovalent cation:H+ antiporter
MFEIAVACLVITALLAYVNHRFIGLPTTVGVMAIALLLSLALIGLDHFGFGALHDYETRLLASIDFSQVLMQGMLSVLLFAGALHVDLSQLHDYRWQVALLAVAGTALSTALVGLGVWSLLPLFGLALPLTWCLVFGALISPTDPIAVIGILKSAGAPDNVGVVVSGESLFNDGIGVVLFSVLLGVAMEGAAPVWSDAFTLLLHEGAGGIALGGAVGIVLFALLRSINCYEVEVMLTLAAVLGGYELAQAVHVSGPLAMVVTGLIIGNHGRELAMSDTTRHHVDLFWKLLDQILNAVLFVLLGLEIVVVPFSMPVFLAALGVILVTLLARWLTVGAPVAGLRGWFKLPRGSWKVLTWGGLRGGISVALALSLPQGPIRNLTLALTYAVVVFSILIQGLTIRSVIAHALSPGRSASAS